MQAECFFNALFDGYQSASLMLEIRRRDLPDEQGKRWCRSAWYPLTEQALTAAYKTALVWQRNADVFFGVLPREGKQRDDASIRECRVLFVEIDGKTQGQSGAIDLLHQSEVYEQFPPHIVIGSGAGAHCYFLLSETAMLPGSSHAQHGLLQKRLCQAIGNQYWDGPNRLERQNPSLPYADPVSTNVSRILRVPETINQKRQAMVSIIETNQSAPRQSKADWDKYLKSAPVPVYRQPRESSPYLPGSLPKATQEALRTRYQEGERYPALRSILRSARGVGASDTTLINLCYAFACNNPGCKQTVFDELVEQTMRRIQPD